MPARSQLQTYRREDGVKTALFIEELVWTNSPRGPKGTLILRANAMTHTRSQLLSHSAVDTYPRGSADNVAAIKGTAWFSEAETVARQAAYGKLRGKLMKGSASLGVTLASLRQSRDMIEKRSHFIASSADTLGALAERNLRRAVTKKMAETYLETIFGWVPLISDIHASCMTVIQGATPPEYVKASFQKRIVNEEEDVQPGWYNNRINYTGTITCKMATEVRVSNPNLWLANRAGLLNPAAVAWDLVPWSFVINMVTNIGSLVNSISDFYGLTMQNASTTVKWDGNRDVSQVNSYPGEWSRHSRDHSIGKWRTLGTPAYPRDLQLRAPDFSWATAGIAASLMIQKARFVGTLLGKIIPDRKP